MICYRSGLVLEGCLPKEKEIIYEKVWKYQYGRTPEEKKRDLELLNKTFFTKDEIQQFKKLNLDLKKIKHITGDDNTLVALYNNSKALIYPSLYEGFGLPILESMSLWCPVICS